MWYTSAVAHTTCVLTHDTDRRVWATSCDLSSVSAHGGTQRTAVVVPNSALLHWLRTQLGADGYRIGVELITLDTLATRVATERAQEPVGSEVYRLILTQPDRPASLADYQDIEGLLLASFRDLHDAGLGPEHIPAMAEALEQDGWWSVDQELIGAWAQWRTAVSATELEDRSDRVRRAVRALELGAPIGFDRLLFYGIYDLTGVMADLVRVLARTVGGRIYFPNFVRSAERIEVPDTPNAYLRDIFNEAIQRSPKSSSPSCEAHWLSGSEWRTKSIESYPGWGRTARDASISRSDVVKCGPW